MGKVPLLDARSSLSYYQNQQARNESQMLQTLQQQEPHDNINVTELLQSVETLRTQNRQLQDDIQRETADRAQQRRASAQVEENPVPSKTAIAAS